MSFKSDKPQVKTYQGKDLLVPGLSGHYISLLPFVSSEFLQFRTGSPRPDPTKWEEFSEMFALKGKHSPFPPFLFKASDMSDDLHSM